MTTSAAFAFLGGCTLIRVFVTAITIRSLPFLSCRFPARDHGMPVPPRRMVSRAPECVNCCKKTKKPSRKSEGLKSRSQLLFLGLLLCLFLRGHFFRLLRLALWFSPCLRKLGTNSSRAATCGVAITPRTIYCVAIVKLSTKKLHFLIFFLTWLFRKCT